MLYWSGRKKLECTPSSQIPFLRLAGTALGVSPEGVQYLVSFTHFIISITPAYVVQRSVAFSTAASGILEQEPSQISPERLSRNRLFPT